MNIVVSSNFIIKPVANIIKYWGNQFSHETNITFSEQLQIIQPLIRPEAEEENSEGYHLIFIRLEDCSADITSLDNMHSEVVAFLNDFKKSLSLYERRSSKISIIIECPSSKKVKKDSTLDIELDNCRKDLELFISSLDNVLYISEKDFFKLYPLENYEDNFSYAAAKIPYTRECYTALGTIAYRKIASLTRRPYKVIVVDCDNTLWKGVVGEGGVSSLIFDQNYLELQRFLVDLKNQGFLLCICSKNIESDIWAVFEHYADYMPLKKEHIVSWKVSWEKKSSSIQEISRELNLSLDSFIFLDDNPAEIHEVKISLPQVECFQVPTIADDIPGFLKHIWLFDKAKIEVSDENRTEYYKQEKERKKIEATFYSYEDFLKELDVKLDILKLTEDQVGRISQMTMRTNQFNFSGIKCTEKEIRNTYLGMEPTCLVVKAKDRYGDYGVIASIFYKLEGVSLIVDNFLLSCRALGKKIEFQIWENLCAIARQHNIHRIYISFIQTERNEPAKKFLESLNIDVENNTSGKLVYCLT